MNHEVENRIIHVGELGWHLLKNGVKILAAGLLLAALLGGLSAFKNARAATQTDPGDGQTPQQMTEALSSEERLALEEALFHFRKAAACEDYAKNSYLFGLNLTQIEKVELAYAFAKTGTNVDPNADPTGVYLTAFSSDEFARALASALIDARDPQYVAELVQCENTGGFFVVSIIVPAGEDAEAIAAAARRFAETIETRAQSVVKHDLTLLSETLLTVRDEDLEETVFTAGAERFESQKELAAKKNALSDAALAVFEKTVNAAEPEDAPPAAIISKKAVVLGFAIGFVGMALALAVRYMTAPVVQYREDPADLFGVRLLGVFEPKFGKKKKKTARLAKIYRLDQAEVVRETAEKTALLLKDAEKTSLYLSLDEDAPQDLAKALQKALAPLGITGVIGERAFCKADNLKAMRACGAVLLLTETEVTRYRDLAEEIETAKDHRVAVIGYAVIG